MSKSEDADNVIVSLGRDVDAPDLKEESLRRPGGMDEPGREALIMRFEAAQSARATELGFILEEWETPVRVLALSR